MGTDSIANFPLRGTSSDVLATALAKCLHDYDRWHGRAYRIATFPDTAKTAGIDRLMENHFAAHFLGKNYALAAKGLATTELEESLERSARIAAVVILHSAFERGIWRLLRFAIVAEPYKVIERVSQNNTTTPDVAAVDRDPLIDQRLERWWSRRERTPLLKNWRSLSDFLGSPQIIRGDMPPLDSQLVETFDDVRHDCVHHGGTKLGSFDLLECAKHLSYVQTVWTADVAERLQLDLSSISQ